MSFLNRFKINVEKFLWSEDSIFHIFLLPLSFIYFLIIKIRRYLYASNIITSKKIPVPVIVVGNITVGGNGKTPFVQWLSLELVKLGYKPCIITRGYGAKAKNYPIVVSQNSDVAKVGDEAKMLYQELRLPIVVDPKRSRAAEYAIKNFNMDIIISDDGLQHYALQRDVEILLKNDTKKFGNCRLLPAGPLREPLSRINNEVITVLSQPIGETVQPWINISAQCLYKLNSPQIKKPLNEINKQEVFLITTIANPKRVYDILQKYNSKIKLIAYPDHYLFKNNDLPSQEDGSIIIVTKKDAVKLGEKFQQDIWVLDYDIQASTGLIEMISSKIN